MRSIILAISLCVATGVHGAPNGILSARAPSTAKTVIAQMFEWTWESIAAECEAFLGPAGYGFVQASPAQEHVQGSEWWTDYQPVSYILTSKRGDRDQYTDMVSRCNAVGVGIIADTIFNHMTGESNGTGVAGSSFTQYNYPGIYSDSDFHSCRTSITSWDDEEQVWNCELDGLADLATETSHVQSVLSAYANDLLSLGVTGLRLDAAKDIDPANIATILSLLDSQPYITQEVIWGEGQPVTPQLYVGNGDVQEFRYTSALQSAFTGGGISSLESFNNLGWVNGSQANVFVTNHDTERANSSLNALAGSNAYVNAMIFSLAHPYGTPTILSSYEGFTDYDAGAPNSGAGTCSGSGGTNGWLCQHRWTGVAGMVGFHNNVGDADMEGWIAEGSNQIAFGRGSLGFAAINNADTIWSTTFSTSMPDGTYCDVISGASVSGACTGVAVIVSGGQFTANVQAWSALAIHTGSVGSVSGTVEVTFAESATTSFGENILLVGSIDQLATWEPYAAIPMSAASYPNWTVTLTLPVNTDFQYKFIRKEADGTINWESDPNRELTTAAFGSQTVTSSWR
ncbi:glycoside hydrolase family 13 protein [Gelatoporia subvermispora B]|uniref:Alpha-amylase n=1 Tax=Ceriporiopsis subvermispora (strain B) TaxID=914234 RepID=M2QWA3_CERS8|nr:glycoside hydrolase family 13 protein [Gelatoporia subvermispora B]